MLNLKELPEGLYWVSSDTKGFALVRVLQFPHGKQIEKSLSPAFEGSFKEAFKIEGSWQEFETYPFSVTSLDASLCVIESTLVIETGDGMNGYMVIEMSKGSNENPSYSFNIKGEEDYVMTARGNVKAILKAQVLSALKCAKELGFSSFGFSGSDSKRDRVYTKLLRKHAASLNIDYVIDEDSDVFEIKAA